MFSRKKLFGVIAGATLALALSFSLAAQADAATLYVATTGQYRSPLPGDKAANRLAITNPMTPAKTITNAAQLSAPGDVIEVAPGTYTDKDTAIIANVRDLSIRGKVGAPRPLIKPTPGDDYAAVKITGSSNITFTGFEVDGINGGRNITGILMVPLTQGTSVKKTHHITIDNNIVHDAGGAGIVTNPDDRDANGCDYITISNNDVYNCLKTGRQGSSGISLLSDENFNNLSGYHNRIQFNKVHDNLINNDPTLIQSDGNGIIIDSTGQYGPRTIVQGNLVYNNGGRGLYVFDSSNVDMISNTCYQNVRAAAFFPEGKPDPNIAEVIVGGSVKDDGIIKTKNVNVINNIVFSRFNVPAYGAVNTGSSTTLGPNIRFSYNSYFGVTPNNGVPDYFIKGGPASIATNMFLLNPGFVDAINRNFRLSNGSLVIDRGTAARYTSVTSYAGAPDVTTTGSLYSLSTFDGLNRLSVSGAGIDLGAYERAKP